MTDRINSILITGAGSGIGQKLAFQLSDHSITVLAAGRRMDALEKTASHNKEKIIPIQADVTNPDDINKLLSAAETLPTPLGLFHGAGYYQMGKLPTLDIEKWNRSFHTNVTARFNLTQKFVPLLKNGKLLFIGSDAGNNIRIGAGAYSIAQSASETLANVFRQELKEHNIAVGIFKPGLVDTDMVQTFVQSDASDFPSVEDYKKIIQSGQIATPDTIAAFATWLLLNTSKEEFCENLWDIRDKWHQEKWLEGNLY